MQAMIKELALAHVNAFNAVAEAATVAAVLDGYRGYLWVFALTENGGLLVCAQRNEPEWDKLQIVGNCRRIEITEEGAQELLKRFPQGS